MHPPVDIERFAGASQSAEQRHGYVTAGRQTPYKKISLAVEALADSDEALVVIGNGPDHKKLEKMAGRNTTFLTKVNDAQIAEQFGGAKAFIFPGVDDFGIVAVEAMAAGTPLIAYHDGGALDYVTSKTGVFFSEPTAASLQSAIKKFESRTYDYNYIQKSAAQFSYRQFRKNMVAYIKQCLK